MSHHAITADTTKKRRTRKIARGVEGSMVIRLVTLALDRPGFEPFATPLLCLRLPQNRNVARLRRRLASLRTRAVKV
jgi:hypothetical protein